MVWVTNNRVYLEELKLSNINCISAFKSMLTPGVTSIMHDHIFITVYRYIYLYIRKHRLYVGPCTLPYVNNLLIYRHLPIHVCVRA